MPNLHAVRTSRATYKLMSGAFEIGCAKHFPKLNRWVASLAHNYDGEYFTVNSASLNVALAEARKAYERKLADEAAEARAEQQAENAWLRAAEAPTWEDMALEYMEREREALFGC